MQPGSTDSVWLVGLDFGSTTTSALMARGRVLRNCVTGRMELGEVATYYRSPVVFTPLDGERLDEERLGRYLDEWMAAAAIERERIASGGAVVTGLAAQRANAGRIAHLVRSRYGDALIATADDPRLESWLAFMGNCLALSRAEPDLPLVNLDIGGGTTNLAWGRDGQVSRVGCYYVGARHVMFEPGGYRLSGLSRYGSELVNHLGIRKGPGDVLDDHEIELVVDFYVTMLEDVVAGRPLTNECARLHVQVPFEPMNLEAGAATDAIITLSGGVGELAYRHALGQPLPGTTAYGDLGIDLARRITQSPILSRSLATHVPANQGRATLVGLTIHNVEVSGSTLFLPDAGLLPLSDLPILGRLKWDASEAEIRALVELAKAAGQGACLQVDCGPAESGPIKQLGSRLAQALTECRFPPEQPFVLLATSNVGKTLGQYASGWGKLNVRLIVIDEVNVREARFANLGRPCQGAVPVAFYGMH
ncbi:MAG: ethanolamine ammonia-lyase reactivating factor EutA [Pirellulales bacterium]